MNIEETIQQEMDQYYLLRKENVDHYGEENKNLFLKYYFMNNFYVYLRDASLGYSRRKYNEWTDRTHREFALSLLRTEDQDYLIQNSSELRLSQTRRQMFEMIDQTAINIGLNLQLLGEFAGKRSLSFEERKQFTEMLFPLYVKLREKGYSHHDLVT